jgi:hypothetical protein
MSRLALLALALALSGCGGFASGYYGKGVDLGAKRSDIACRIPANGPWTETIVIANMAQACRDEGGVPLK